MPTIRPATDADADADAVIDIIDGCYREYDGCVLLVDEEEPALKAPASAFAEIGGAFWVAETETDGIIGTIAVAPADAPGYARIHKLYVAKKARGRGLGAKLCVLAEEMALGFGADRMVLFTDARFTEAQRLYERLGYHRLPGAQKRADASHSVEYFYSKSLK
ncbi:MAG: GNAT family N-acetyltransferase [Magnetovibrio sp.]|nr:GNAT family N-acetyltransferase [Magnetovibrio sp.]